MEKEVFDLTRLLCNEKFIRSRLKYMEKTPENLSGIIHLQKEYCLILQTYNDHAYKLITQRNTRDFYEYNERVSEGLDWLVEYAKKP